MFISYVVYVLLMRDTTWVCNKNFHGYATPRNIALIFFHILSLYPFIYLCISSFKSFHGFTFHKHARILKGIKISVMLL